MNKYYFRINRYSLQLLSFKDNQQRKANEIIPEKIAIQCLYFKKETDLNGGMLFNIK